MASCARFNLAAETIFIALVICIVELTEEILFLISFKLAIIYFMIKGWNGYDPARFISFEKEWKNEGLRRRKPSSFLVSIFSGQFVCNRLQHACKFVCEVSFFLGIKQIGRS